MSRETPEELRLRALKELRIESPVKAHEQIVNGIKGGAARLLQRGLNSQRLIQLGYTREGMKRLGCDDAFLVTLGYPAPPAPKAAAASASVTSAPEGAGA